MHHNIAVVQVVCLILSMFRRLRSRKPPENDMLLTRIGFLCYFSEITVRLQILKGNVQMYIYFTSDEVFLASFSFFATSLSPEKT